MSPLSGNTDHAKEDRAKVGNQKTKTTPKTIGFVCACVGCSCSRRRLTSKAWAARLVRRLARRRPKGLFGAATCCTSYARLLQIHVCPPIWLWCSACSSSSSHETELTTVQVQTFRTTTLAHIDWSCALSSACFNGEQKAILGNNNKILLHNWLTGRMADEDEDEDGHGHGIIWLRWRTESDNNRSSNNNSTACSSLTSQTLLLLIIGFYGCSLSLVSVWCVTHNLRQRTCTPSRAGTLNHI